MYNKNIMIYYIYTLANNNGIFYVGKTNNISKRLTNHKITYGKNIKLEILSETLDSWKEEEKYWIEQLKGWGFNLKNKNQGGGGPDFNSEETRLLISKNQPITKYRNPETNIKIGLSHKGLKKKPCSDERKNKISKSNKGKQFNLGKKYNTITFKKVIQYDLQNNFIKEWNSVKEILYYMDKMKKDSIYKCLCGKSKTAYNFKWKYKNKE
jgi:hypothetical protein